MQEHEFFAHVTQLGGPSDRDEAARVTQIVLEDLGQRLKGSEPSNLAAQLPESLKPFLDVHDDAEPVIDDVDDFLRRVSRHLGEGVTPEQAQVHVGAVFGALRRAVSEGEIDDIRSQLPAGFAPLLSAVNPHRSRH